MVLTTIPYLIAFQKALPSDQTPTWRFSGFLFGVEDGNSYIAKMRRGMEGEWFFRSSYSGMKQKGVLAVLPYTLLGKLAGGKGAHEQLVVLFHWFRIGAGLSCILVTYRFLCEFLLSTYWRRVALVLITIGGGLGWLILLFRDPKVLPLEFYSPEAFGFLSLYGLPHLSLARALMLLALIEYLKIWETAVTTERNVHLWRLSAAWLAAGLSQPIQAGILSILLVFHLIVEATKRWYWRTFSVKKAKLKAVILSVVWASCLPLALLIYTAYSFLTDPYLKIWAAQNRLPPAPISLYFLSYGWLFPLVIGGIVQSRDWGNERLTLLLAWLVTGMGLIFTPITIQRRLIEGVWIVLVLLAMRFVESLHRIARQQKFQRLVVFLLFLLTLPSSILLVIGGIQSALTPKTPIFVSYRDTIGYETLNQFQKAKDAVILASYETSNVLPAYAFVRVISGHGPESPSGETVLKDIRKFYQAQTPSEFRQDFIQRYQIQYIVWGDNERKLGDWQPRLEDYLIPVYENESLVIFEVDRAKMDY
jgi:hypothetical protein